jgi:hypothetical protein
MEIVEIKEKIIEDLGEEIDSNDFNEIYNIIIKYISRVHPDKYTDEKLKNENIEKTKKATAILSIIKSEIEKERIKSTSLIPIDEIKIQLENIEYKSLLKDQEIIEYKKLIDKQNNEINAYKQNIIELEKAISLERNKNISIGKEYVSNRYKPKKNQYLFTGTIGSLLIIYNIFSHIESISVSITKYLPFNEKTINIILFSVLIISLFIIIYKIFKSITINNFLDEIITQVSISKFNNIISYNRISKQDIYDEIINRINKMPWYKKIYLKLMGVNNQIIVNEGMNNVINYLLNNKYVEEKSTIDNMNEYFKIKSSDYWNM